MTLYIRKHAFELSISALFFLIVVALFWLPFGLKTTDVADGWLNFPKVERNSMVSLIGGSRPLVYLPWKLAYLISNDSYMGVGLVLAALFWGRAFVFYWILRNLRLADPSLAFFISVLFILYPADQGLFLMRALGRHTAVFFYFLAVLFLILAGRRPHPVYLMGMILAEGISALIAEQGYSLILLTPLLLLADNDSLGRKKIQIAIGWYLVLLLAVVNYLIGAKGHQEKILADGQAANTLQYLTEVIISNLLAYKQVFIDGWLKAFERMGDIQLEYGYFGLAVAIITVAASYLLSRVKNDNEDVSVAKISPLVAILAGLAIIGLTFFPYSLTSFRYVYSRVFYYAAGGGALVFGILFSQMTQRFPRWERALNLSFFGVVIFVVAINGFSLRSSLVQTSQRQQRILVSIVEQAPFVKQNTTIVLMCDKKRPFTRLDYVFRAALSWTYKQEKIRALQCGSLSDCEIPYQTSMIFECEQDNSVSLLRELPAKYQDENVNYQPYDRIKGYAPFPERAQTAFDFVPNPSNLVPKEWASDSQSLNDRKVCNVSYAGECSLLFFDDGVPTSFSQVIEIEGGAHEYFKFSFWGKSRELLDEPIGLATILLHYRDGTEEEHYVFGQPSEKWAFYWLEFETAKPYDGMIITLHSNIISVSIWLDDVRLFQNAVEILVENSSFE